MPTRDAARAAICLFVSAVAICPLFADESRSSPPKTITELQTAIEGVLKETNTPGGGVVLVTKDKVIWAAEFGVADRALGQMVTPDTMFRAGSISKTLVALAFLKLEAEGKLSLDDRVSQHAGDATFSNPWEAEHPLRVVHLLEHTSGFREQSSHEYAVNIPNVSLQDALAYDSRARVSRWQPGMFYTYSNANYDLAGRLLERVTNRSFDEYMENDILTPLGMKDASFLLTDSVRTKLATGYAADGFTAVPEDHMLGRPSGALMVTPRNLARLVQLLLNRGNADGTHLYSSSAIHRMERPTTSAGARQGMVDGYGLGNYSKFNKGFRFYGHSGSRHGYVAQFAYSPDYGVGYAFMLNGRNYDARQQIGSLLMDHLSCDWLKPAIDSSDVRAEQLERFCGYFEPYALRDESYLWHDRLFGVQRVFLKERQLRFSGSTQAEPLIPVAGQNLFREHSEPSASIAFVPNGYDLFLVTSSETAPGFRRITAWRAWSQSLLAVACYVLMVSPVLFALIWIPRKLLGYMKGVRYLSLQVLPLATLLSLVLIQVIFGRVTHVNQLGQMTVYSVSIWALSWVFAITTLVAFIQTIRIRKAVIHPWAWRYSFAVSIANMIALIYFATWGLIGIRTWV